MTRRRKGGSDSHFYYKWLDKALCDLQCALFRVLKFVNFLRSDR